MASRILHITAGLELGGAEALLVEAASRSKERGQDPFVVALKSGGGNRARLAARGIPVIELGVNPACPDPRALFRLSRFVGEYRPTILQSWMYHANLFTLAALRLRHRVLIGNLVWGIYNTRMQLDRYSWRLRMGIALGARWSQLPAAIVYNAEQARLDHEAIGFRARQCLVIRNGIDTMRFRPDDRARTETRAKLGLAGDAVVALIVARCDPQKDWPTVLAAAGRAPGVTILAVGPGTDRLPDRPGLVKLGPQMDMAPLYAAADIFILPSAFGEGTSDAMSEAMACGLPVIVSDVGDNPRYATRAGYIVPKSDPAALVERIAVLAADPALRRRLGKAARRIAVAEFDAATNFGRLYDLYDRISAGAE